LPRKDFSDRLVEIRNNAEIVEMIDVVKENKVLCLYVDHTNFVKGLRNDVLKYGRPQKPAVLSAQEIHGDDHVTIEEEAHDRNDLNNDKVVGEEIQICSARVRGEEIQSSLVRGRGEEIRRNKKKQSVEEAKDETDSEFVDCDYDVEDGDDDMFAANIDMLVQDHNEPFEIVGT
jgi:hypothetical protein